MNKFFGITLATACLSAGTVLAQSSSNDAPVADQNDKIIKPASDMFMLQLSYEGWGNQPDSIKTKWYSRGIAAYILNDWKIKNSNFSFAGGIGFSVSNIFFNDQRASLDGSGSAISFPTVNGAGSTSQYKGMKYKVTYVEAPLEFRFYADKYNRNRGFKLAAGAKIGLLVGGSSKYKETIDNSSSTYVTYKENTKRYAATWRFSPTIRIGWGNFSLVGSYSITTLFNSGQGPAVHPFSVGLCISGL